MWKLRKRVWIPAVTALLSLYLSVYAPGPVEGKYRASPCGCMDAYEFYYFNSNVAMIVSKTHPPVDIVGSYSKTNSTWLWRETDRKTTTDYCLEPHLVYMRVRDPRWEDGRQDSVWVRDFAFWKTRKILADPEQWQPKQQKSRGREK